MIPWISIGIWLLTIGYDLYTDTKKEPNANTWVIVRHFRGTVLRIPSFIVIFILSDWHLWGIFGFAYWALFNLGWNIRMKQKPFRRGTTSLLDRTFPVWVPWAMLAISIFGYFKF